MNNTKFISILIVYTIVLLTSCSTNKFQSYNYIDGDYQKIKSMFYYRDTMMVVENLHIVEKGDSLIVASLMNNQPWEALYLFKNGKCYYQKLNIYCSECADKMVNDIIKDKNFNFKAVSPVNYVSQNKEGVILRLKDKVQENGNCNEITIHRIGEK